MSVYAPIYTLSVPVPCRHCGGEMPAGERVVSVPRVGMTHQGCAQAAWTAIRAPELAAEEAARDRAIAATGIRPGARVRRKAHGTRGLVGVVREVDATHAVVAWPSNRLGGDGTQRSRLKLTALAVADGAGR